MLYMFKHNRTETALHFSFYYFFDLLPNNILLYILMTINIY